MMTGGIMGHQAYRIRSSPFLTSQELFQRRWKWVFQLPYTMYYATWNCGKVHESINRSFCTITWISLRFERPRKEFGGISSMSLLSGMRISENYNGDDLTTNLWLLSSDWPFDWELPEIISGDETGSIRGILSEQYDIIWCIISL